MGYTNNAEDKLLLSKAYDAIALSERTGCPRFLGFLNEHELSYLRANISPKRDVSYFGGYPDAVRVMLGAAADEYSFPIVALEFSYKPEFDLRHRDFLGSLMALGLRRETIGDILCEKGRAVAFVRDDIADFILSQVDKIGRVGVKIAYADLTDLPVPDDTEELSFTLSSLRLDAFVAAVTNLSRDKAARLIKSELVMIDHVISTDVSKPLSVGATVTIRKYGKYVLSEDAGLTRKGRLRISVKHFR
ncbi:MAG: hypothetical protein IJ639_07440 [Ruminococcus sp.]|nr:hypothetical protein [Ruminococcus sp.]